METASETEQGYVLIVRQGDGEDRGDASCALAVAASQDTRTSSDSEDALEVTFVEPEEANEVDEFEPAVEVDAAPLTVPFLPALDASTEITKFEGYAEAIFEAQTALDCRLMAYTQYLGMTPGAETLIATRRMPCPRAAVSSKPLAGDRPITVCMGWQRVSNIDSTSRDLLRLLEEDGVTYMPHDITYSVKYLAPVAPFGDCMFLSMEQLLLHTDGCEHLPTYKIRRMAAKYFLAHYEGCGADEKNRIDTAIRNLYFPTLKGGWGVSPIQTRRYVARCTDKDWLFAKCVELQEKGFSRLKAAEIAYSQHAQAVCNATAYCDYMAIGNGSNTHFMIALNYTQNGLISVDSDPENRSVAWGDDISLEALATAYQRDIFVVLVGCGKMFFLPHRPRTVPGLADAGLSRSKGNAPWFLLMRLTGSDRGGDHYEPMLCERLRGDGSDELGNIGD